MPIIDTWAETTLLMQYQVRYGQYHWKQWINTLTQYNPITAGVNNYFRYLNKSRTELPKQNWAV